MALLQRENFVAVEKYFKGDKHSPVNMGNILIDYMSGDSKNKIEAQKWVGLDGNIKNKDLKDLLYRSDFKTERKTSSSILTSTNGELFVALVMIDGEYVISFFEPISYRSIKTKVIEMTAVGSGTVSISGNREAQLNLRWYTREDGRVVRDTFYVNNGKDVIQETFIFPENVKFVPGKIIRNNGDSAPDWYRAAEIFKEMNLLSNDIGPEWENIKTMWISNGNMGSGKQQSQRQKSINNGSRTSNEEYSVNGKFGEQFGVMISGSSSLQVLVQAIVFMEDRALKYTFQGRDSDNSGTNKTTMQVGLFNQAHAEYTLEKIDQRQDDYMRFFKDVVEPITGIKAPSSIVISNSAYEQGKIDALKLIESQKEYAKQQSAAQKQQAIKHAASAEKALAETAQIEKETEQIGQEVTPTPKPTEEVTE